MTGKARYCAQCRDKDGMLPIHLACISGAKVATIELLLNAFPQSVLLKDGRGNTPLQLAKLSPSSRNKQSTVSNLLSNIEFFTIFISCVDTFHLLARFAAVISR